MNCIKPRRAFLSGHMSFAEVCDPQFDPILSNLRCYTTVGCSDYRHYMTQWYTAAAKLVCGCVPECSKPHLCRFATVQSDHSFHGSKYFCFCESPCVDATKTKCNSPVLVAKSRIEYYQGTRGRKFLEDCIKTRAERSKESRLFASPKGLLLTSEKGSIWKKKTIPDSPSASSSGKFPYPPIHIKALPVQQHRKGIRDFFKHTPGPVARMSAAQVGTGKDGNRPPRNKGGFGALSICCDTAHAEAVLPGVGESREAQPSDLGKDTQQPGEEPKSNDGAGDYCVAFELGLDVFGSSCYLFPRDAVLWAHHDSFSEAIAFRQANKFAIVAWVQFPEREDFDIHRRKFGGPLPCWVHKPNKQDLEAAAAMASDDLPNYNIVYTLRDGTEHGFDNFRAAMLFCSGISQSVLTIREFPNKLSRSNHMENRDCTSDYLVAYEICDSDIWFHFETFVDAMAFRQCNKLSVVGHRRFDNLATYSQHRQEHSGRSPQKLHYPGPDDRLRAAAMTSDDSDDYYVSYIFLDCSSCQFTNFRKAMVFRKSLENKMAAIKGFRCEEDFLDYLMKQATVAKNPPEGAGTKKFSVVAETHTMSVLYQPHKTHYFGTTAILDSQAIKTMNGPDFSLEILTDYCNGQILIRDDISAMAFESLDADFECVSRAFQTDVGGSKTQEDVASDAPAGAAPFKAPNLGQNSEDSDSGASCDDTGSVSSPSPPKKRRTRRLHSDADSTYQDNNSSCSSEHSLGPTAAGPGSNGNSSASAGSSVSSSCPEDDSFIAHTDESSARSESPSEESLWKEEDESISS